MSRHQDLLDDALTVALSGCGSTGMVRGKARSDGCPSTVAGAVEICDACNRLVVQLLAQAALPPPPAPA